LDGALLPTLPQRQAVLRGFFDYNRFCRSTLAGLPRDAPTHSLTKPTEFYACLG
jgi:hypothetical protein